MLGETPAGDVISTAGWPPVGLQKLLVDFNFMVQLRWLPPAGRRATKTGIVDKFPGLQSAKRPLFPVCFYYPEVATKLLYQLLSVFLAPSWPERGRLVAQLLI